MTVSSNTDRATLLGNGVATVFPLPFRFFFNSEIQAGLLTNTTGELTPLTLGTHYSLDGAGLPEVDGNAASVLTMFTAPSALQSLYVQRVMPISQPTDIVNQGKFLPEIHENVFDRLTMLIQQANGEGKGAIRVAVGDPEPSRLVPAAQRANLLLGFDSQGNPITVAPVSGSASDLAMNLANNVDPSKGAAMIGYKGNTQADHNRAWARAADFGAVGDGSANDTAAVISAFNAGHVLFDGVFKCDPFTITGKKLDAHFTPGSKLVFTHQGSNSATFTGCSGEISGIEIDDAQESIAGIYISLFLNACTDLVVNRPLLRGGKDLPIAVYQSDNCHIVDGVGIGTDLNRPFAWELVSCKASTFTRCRLYKYNFGFTLIGPGYKSGSILPSTRGYADTLGMQAVDCYVEDHFGHAFDMNGTTGAGFSGCTAKSYTGTVGNSSFQVKQSTNIPEELDDDTFINWVDNCLAEDCVNGFGLQQGTDVRLTNINVIRAKRYPVTLNSTKRVNLNGLFARDWGLDLAAWPLQNSDTICAAVAIWNGSDYCTVENVTASLTDATNPNIATLALCNVVGANCSIGTFRYRRETGVSGTIARALKISGSNTLIGEGFRPGDATLFAAPAVEDATNTTMYPLEYGISVPLNATGTFILPNVPQRGLTVCKVFALATTAPGGSPQYSVGRNGGAATLVAQRAAPATSEFLDPVTLPIASNLALAVAIAVAGSSGQLSVSVRGIHSL